MIGEKSGERSLAWVKARGDLAFSGNKNRQKIVNLQVKLKGNRHMFQEIRGTD
jgi:hypothetical protein